MKDSIDIRIYETDSGKSPYLQWENKLSRVARAAITSRLDRVTAKLFRDSREFMSLESTWNLDIVSILANKALGSSCYSQVVIKEVKKRISKKLMSIGRII